MQRGFGWLCVPKSRQVPVAQFVVAHVGMQLPLGQKAFVWQVPVGALLKPSAARQPVSAVHAAPGIAVVVVQACDEHVELMVHAWQMDPPQPQVLFEVPVLQPNCASQQPAQFDGPHDVQLPATQVSLPAQTWQA